MHWQPFISIVNLNKLNFLSSVKRTAFPWTLFCFNNRLRKVFLSLFIINLENKDISWFCFLFALVYTQAILGHDPGLLLTALGSLLAVFGDMGGGGIDHAVT